MKFVRLATLISVVAATLLVTGSAFAGGPDCEEGSTTVKGHCERDGVVNGHYTQDAYGCRYVVNYRGDFGPDPYLDNGRIMNNINCAGGSVGSDNPNAHTNFNFMFVSEGEPQHDESNYWGTWDWEICTEPGSGNLGDSCAE